MLNVAKTIPASKRQFFEAVHELDREIARKMPGEANQDAQFHFADCRKPWSGALWMAKFKIRQADTTPKQAKALSAKTIADIRRDVAEYERSAPRIVLKLNKERAARIRPERKAAAAMFGDGQMSQHMAVIERFIDIRNDRFNAAYDASHQEDLPVSAPVEKPKKKFDDTKHDFDPGRGDGADITPASDHSIEPHDFWAAQATEKIRRGMLPELIENIAFEYSERTGLDRDTLATSMIVVASGVISTNIRVANSHDVDETFKEVPRIWQANHGPAGSGKSPILKAVTRAIDEIEEKLEDEYNVAIADFNSHDKNEQKEIDRPVRRRIKLANDTSTESAQRDLCESPDGLLGEYDELVGFLGSKSRYNHSGGSEQAARGFWLPTYDSKRFALTRVGRPSISGFPSCSIIAGVQPDTMQQLAEASQNNDGLIQRFGVVMMPDSPGQPRESDGRAKYPMTLFDDLIRNMYGHCPLRLSGTTLYFSPQAAAVKKKFFEWVTDQVAFYRDTSPALASHLNKYKGMFLRFCGVFHMIDHWADKQPRTISYETAMKVYKFLTGPRVSHARAFYEALRQNEENNDLVNIAEFILAKQLAFVSAREMQRGSARLRKISTHDIAKLVGTLVSLGWLHWIVGKRTDSFNWKVSPDVHVRFKDRTGLIRDKFAERQRIAKENFDNAKQLNGDDDET